MFKLLFTWRTCFCCSWKSKLIFRDVKRTLSLNCTKTAKPYRARPWPRLRRPPAAARVATIRSLVVVSGLGTWISVSAYSEANIPGDSTVQLKSVDGYVSKALTKCLHYEN